MTVGQSTTLLFSVVIYAIATAQTYGIFEDRLYPTPPNLTDEQRIELVAKGLLWPWFLAILISKIFRQALREQKSANETVDREIKRWDCE